MIDLDKLPSNSLHFMLSVNILLSIISTLAMTHGTRTNIKHCVNVIFKNNFITFLSHPTLMRLCFNPRTKYTSKIDFLPRFVIRTIVPFPLNPTMSSNNFIFYLRYHFLPRFHQNNYTFST